MTTHKEHSFWCGALCPTGRGGAGRSSAPGSPPRAPARRARANAGVTCPPRSNGSGESPERPKGPLWPPGRGRDNGGALALPKARTNRERIRRETQGPQAAKDY